MKKQKFYKKAASTVMATAIAMGNVCLPVEAADQKWSETQTADGWNLVENEGGKTLGYSPDSGVTLLEDDCFAFKDLNKNGQLDEYEDWRLDADTRATSLANSLSAEDIFPLLFHNGLTSLGNKLADTDEELLDQGMRAGVIRGASPENAEMSVKYTNAVQAYVEKLGNGIPFSLSTDPVIISDIPSNLSLAATFDPEIVARAYQEESKQYRAIGINTLLGPQMDIMTDPRWWRGMDTFGEDPALSRDMAKAAVNALQSTYDEDGNDLGWGEDSVIGIIKHFPGDGAAEGGREAHNAFGKIKI